jgi:murein DD-endopeptidase MepM/ murein hydrolase activator NlpD
MKHQDLLDNLINPVPGAILKKYPAGNIFQYWADNPALYSQAFGHTDDLHRYLGGHSGIDISGKHRTPIVAAHDGHVDEMKTDRTSLGGIVVWLQSPMLELDTKVSCVTTAYAHLDEAAVKKGSTVKQGDLIGYMGNTGMIVSGGNAYWGNAPAGVGTHLHFGINEFILTSTGAWVPRFINQMGNTTDPLSYLTKGKELGGLAVILRNMLTYLGLPKFRST